MRRILPILAASLLLPPLARAAEFDAGHVFVASPGANRIFEFEPDGQFVRELGATFDLGGPWGLAFGPDGKLYVSGRFSGTISVLDGDGSRIREMNHVGFPYNGPQGLCFAPDGDLLLALTLGNAVVRLDAESGQIQDTLAPVGLQDVTDVAVGPDGRIWASCWNIATIVVLQPDGEIADQVTNGLDSPERVLFASGGRLFVASKNTSSILIYDKGVNGPATVLDGTDGLVGPMGLAHAPGDRIYVGSSGSNQVLAFDGDQPAATLQHASMVGPVGVAVAPTRLRAKLVGTLYHGVLVGQGPGTEPAAEKVKGKAELTLDAGTGTAFVRVTSPGAAFVLEAEFGSATLVCHGFEEQAGKKILSVGFQRPADPFRYPSAALSLLSRTNKKTGGLTLKQSSGDLLAATSVATLDSELKSVKPLN